MPNVPEAARMPLVPCRNEICGMQISQVRNVHGSTFLTVSPLYFRLSPCICIVSYNKVIEWSYVFWDFRKVYGGGVSIHNYELMMRLLSLCIFSPKKQGERIRRILHIAQNNEARQAFESREAAKLCLNSLIILRGIPQQSDSFALSSKKYDSSSIFFTGLLI